MKGTFTVAQWAMLGGYAILVLGALLYIAQQTSKKFSQRMWR